jgi:thymidylate synthase
MINLIVAISKNYGIGYRNNIPWNIPEDLKIFRRKTSNCVMICGRKTLASLPKLDLADRNIICVSNGIYQHENHFEKHITARGNYFSCCPNFEDALELAKTYNKEIFVIGGQQIYDYVFKNYKPQIALHISFIKEEYNCDAFFSHDLKSFSIVSEEIFDDFEHRVLRYTPLSVDEQYISIVKDIFLNGKRRRTRNSDTISSFAKHMSFDLRNGFPLLTTKKMFFKGIVEELLFFLKGETDTTKLEAKGVNIWKKNTSRNFLDTLGMTNRDEGVMGPMYGYQWRNFGAPYSEETKSSLTNGVDQLSNVVRLITNEPTSRRIMMSTFNPSQADEGVLYPCHSIIIQFYVENEFCLVTNKEISYLDLYCYNRSNDIGLGLPFNIASTSLLLMIVAKITCLTPRFVNISIGDAHIYAEHVDEMCKQIERVPYDLPEVLIPDITNISEINELTCDQFILRNYKCHKQLNMQMIA